MDSLPSIELTHLHAFRYISTAWVYTLPTRVAMSDLTSLEGILKKTHTFTFSLSSFGLHIRRRRTPNKAAGCALVTCALHDLLFNLHRMSNTAREVNAPEKKMGSGGYGRRRRSLLDVSRLSLQTGRQRRSIEAGQRVHRHKSTRTVS